MILQVFAVYDIKARAYMSPFFMPNREMAVRAFSTGVNEEKSELNKHPADFTLFHIGAFDDETGNLEPLQNHFSLGLASQYRVRKDD